MSASISSNCCCDISPSSTRICAASSCSLSAASSFSSVSTAAAILSNTKRRPPTSSESRMNIGNSSVGSLESKPDVDEVVRRPRTGELERQLVVALADVLDPRVECLFEAARHQERRVHDHAVANRFVRSRGDRYVPQRLEDLGHEPLRLRLKR